jgi:hypothetical protein
MRRSIVLVLSLAACSPPPPAMRDAAPTDANRACGVPLQLEITLADRGDCAAPPIVILVTDATGAVQSASARVPRGVTVPSIACSAAGPTAGGAACSWALALRCTGPDGERLDLDGALVGSGSAWTSDALTAALTGLPPGRLTCTATSSATTR